MNIKTAQLKKKNTLKKPKNTKGSSRHTSKQTIQPMENDALILLNKYAQKHGLRFGEALSEILAELYGSENSNLYFISNETLSMWINFIC